MSWNYLTQIVRPEHLQQQQTQPQVTNPYVVANAMNPPQQASVVRPYCPFSAPSQPQQIANSASPWALVANSQVQSVQSMLQSDNETGSSNKAPKMLHLNEYHSWKGRIQRHIEGIDVDIWYWVEHPLIRPRQENSHEPVELTQLSDEEKKKYKDERKAFSILTQALPKEILHQYEVCETAYDLWNLLKTRCEGDERAFKIRQDQLKKEFEAFCHFGNEPLRDMQSRFYHLMNELRKHQINYTTPELIERFADALPPHWTQYVDMLKELGQYESLSIADFLRKLENREIEESRKAKRTPLPQNPDVYHAGIPTTSNPTTSTRPQTAFVSSMVNDPFACNPPQ